MVYHHYTMLTVTILDHPKGILTRINHDGGEIYLDAAETADLYDQLHAKLPELPSAPATPDDSPEHIDLEAKPNLASSAPDGSPSVELP
jgi:hypothetical protein